MINLKDIVLDTKEVEVAFPGFDTFKVRLQYISRTTSKKLLENSEVKEFKGAQLINIRRDEDKFSDEFVKHCITGWSGLTLDIASHLLLIDIEGKDPSVEVPYSHDNAVMLLKNSVAFNTFIDQTVFDLDTFRTSK